MKNKIDLIEYLEPVELAAKLKTNTQTLANWRSTGTVEIPFVKIGRKVLYPVDAVNDWLAKNTFQHTGEVKHS